MASNTASHNHHGDKKFVESVTVRVPQLPSSSSSPLSPSKTCRFVPDCCSVRSPIEYAANFKRSGAPARVMFFQNESWIDFPGRVVELVRSGFLERKAVVHVEFEGSTYMFDFVRMLQIDSETGSQRSISWFDNKGKCFFPREFVTEAFGGGGDGDGDGSENPKMQIEIQVDFSGRNSGKRKYEAVEEEKNEVTSSKRQLVEEDKSSSTCLWPNVKLLRKGERAYDVVRNFFLGGMSKVDPDGATVSAIRQCVRNGPMDRARFEVFRNQIDITKAARGSANAVYAWYGASARDIQGILTHGFGVPDKVSGSEACGVGVHLSPLSLPHVSAGLSEADDDGQKYLLLCRVILGNVEKVKAGSQQRYPSSPEFDTGADDIKDPKRYVVWSTNMNRHILPECVVSYKWSNPVPVQLRGPTRRLYPVTELVLKIRNSLPPLKAQQLSTLLNALRAGKVTKNDFFKQFRSVTGEQLLLSAIREMHGPEQGS